MNVLSSVVAMTAANHHDNEGRRSPSSTPEARVGMLLMSFFYGRISHAPCADASFVHCSATLIAAVPIKFQ
jgi:hypothetical protein